MLLGCNKLKMQVDKFRSQEVSYEHNSKRKEAWLPFDVLHFIFNVNQNIILSKILVPCASTPLHFAVWYAYPNTDIFIFIVACFNVNRILRVFQCKHFARAFNGGMEFPNPLWPSENSKTLHFRRPNPTLVSFPFRNVRKYKFNI